MALWSALSLLPDADVIGFGLGVEYADRWGHRGATHSLTVLVAVGLAIGLAARWFKRPIGRTALAAIALLASHAVLDTMTDGGLGCALFWPFNPTRYFAPWRPIPVAPIGLGFFSASGGIIALTEFVLFSPAIVFALPSRSMTARSLAAGFFLGAWFVSLWLILSGDPIREAIVGFVVREDTAYTSGFSEKAFRTISPGESDEEVGRVLGAPHGETWFYAPADQPFQRAITMSASSLPHECLAVGFSDGIVVTAFDRDSCKKFGIERGTSLNAVQRLLGSPRESCWRYSWSPQGRHHRLRLVCFSNGSVETLVRRWAYSE
jgi:inner membrane protein